MKNYSYWIAPKMRQTGRRGGAAPVTVESGVLFMGPGCAPADTRAVGAVLQNLQKSASSRMACRAPGRTGSIVECFAGALMPQARKKERITSIRGFEFATVGLKALRISLTTWGSRQTVVQSTASTETLGMSQKTVDGPQARSRQTTRHATQLLSTTGSRKQLQCGQENLESSKIRWSTEYCVGFRLVGQCSQISVSLQQKERVCESARVLRAGSSSFRAHHKSGPAPACAALGHAAAHIGRSEGSDWTHWP